MRDGKKAEGGGEDAELNWLSGTLVRPQDVSVLRGSDCGAIERVDDGGIAENV